MRALFIAFPLLLMAHFSNSLAASLYETVYSDCVQSFGTINNSIVFQCSEKAIEMAEEDMQVKIQRLRDTRLAKDFGAFLEAQRNWRIYASIQCDLQTEYIGSPMFKYCPMMMLIDRHKELDILLESLIP